MSDVLMRIELCDKRGIPLKEFDLIKMYHFTGARRKKYYMHKLVVVRGGLLYGHHLNSEDFSGLNACFRLTQPLLNDSEIVQGYDKDGKDFSDRPSLDALGKKMHKPKTKPRKNKAPG